MGDDARASRNVERDMADRAMGLSHKKRTRMKNIAIEIGWAMVQDTVICLFHDRTPEYDQKWSNRMAAHITQAGRHRINTTTARIHNIAHNAATGTTGGPRDLLYIDILLA